MLLEAEVLQVPMGASMCNHHSEEAEVHMEEPPEEPQIPGGNCLCQRYFPPFPTYTSPRLDSTVFPAIFGFRHAFTLFKQDCKNVFSPCTIKSREDRPAL
jgi:hypothetical protein